MLDTKQKAKFWLKDYKANQAKPDDNLEMSLLADAAPIMRAVAKLPDNKIILPAMPVKDLKKVIAYLYDDELKNFEESEAEGASRPHIWQSVCAVENWLMKIERSKKHA